MNYRLYSFVAGLYLSDLQKGLQTAHVVSEIASNYVNLGGKPHPAFQKFTHWATTDKTIIILNALNQQGVLDAYAAIQQWERSRVFQEFPFPHALFREDEQSMNGMATACGIVLPENIYDTRFYEDPCGNPDRFEHVKLVDGVETVCDVYIEGTATFDFIKKLKSYRLA